MTNRKLHMRFRLTPRSMTWMTLNCINSNFQRYVFAWFQCWYVVVSTSVLDVMPLIHGPSICKTLSIPVLMWWFCRMVTIVDCSAYFSLWGHVQRPPHTTKTKSYWLTVNLTTNRDAWLWSWLEYAVPQNSHSISNKDFLLFWPVVIDKTVI